MWISLFYIVPCIVSLVTSWIIAGFFQEVAIMKGHEEDKYFWVSFLIPIAGYLLIIALPDKNIPTSASKMGSKDELPDL